MTATLERTAAVAPSSGGSTLTGTGRLIRFILRRDRVRLSVWTGSIVAFYAYFTFALGLMGETPEALQARGTVMETPAGIVMGGPGYGVESYTVGVAMANEGIVWVVLALAILSIQHVVRHTRAEEESGRSELVRAAVVGRHAPPVAAVITLAGINAVIAVLSALAMIGVGGTAEIPVADAFAMTVGCALSAMVFGAAALVLCQLVVHGRGAFGLSLAVFGIAFLVQVAGNLRDFPGGSPLSWFSPIAWAQQMRAFVELRWWPAALGAVAVLALLWLAAVLGSRRDFGGGMIPERRGRPDAPVSLTGPAALAWRQQRMALMWSCLGLGIMWALSGSMVPAINDMVADMAADNPMMAALFGTDTAAFTASFLSIMMVFAVLCVAGYAIVMAVRPKAEEESGRVEVTLARPVGRTRWFGAQLAVAAGGTVVLLVVSVYAMWAGAAAVGELDPSIGDYSVVVLSYLPAVLVYLGLAAALYAWAPRWTGVAWALLAYSFFMLMFGTAWEDMPEAAGYASPLYWVPDAFVEDVDVVSLLGLSAVAVVLGALALVGFRRRDIASS